VCWSAAVANFEDRDLLTAALDRLSKDRGFSLVISGGARGADTLAEERADAVGLPCTVYNADWRKLGRKAGQSAISRCLRKADRSSWWHSQANAEPPT
jgi:hypothetical protein